MVSSLLLQLEVLVVDLVLPIYVVNIICIDIIIQDMRATFLILINVIVEVVLTRGYKITDWSSICLILVSVEIIQIDP